MKIAPISASMLCPPIHKLQEDTLALDTSKVTRLSAPERLTKVADSAKAATANDPAGVTGLLKTGVVKTAVLVLFMYLNQIRNSAACSPLTPYSLLKKIVIS